MEDNDELNHGSGLVSRKDAPQVPVVYFPLPNQGDDSQDQKQMNDSAVQNDGNISDTTVIIDDEEEELDQETLGERVEPTGKEDTSAAFANSIQVITDRSMNKVQVISRGRRTALYSNPYFEVIDID